MTWWAPNRRSLVVLQNIWIFEENSSADKQGLVELQNIWIFKENSQIFTQTLLGPVYLRLNFRRKFKYLLKIYYIPIYSLCFACSLSLAWIMTKSWERRMIDKTWWDDKVIDKDDRQEEAEVGEDKHLCSIFNLHAGKCPQGPATWA